MLVAAQAFGSSKEPITVSDFLALRGIRDTPQSFQKHVSQLESKKPAFRKERDFVRFLFVKTHQRFLKQYTEYVPFDQLFDDGTYNCLSATILYSLLLTHFNIDHDVIETNYHIFILATTRQGQVLIETTDPLNGFISAETEIATRLEKYKNDNVITANANAVQYRFSFNLFNIVSMHELQGLMHYNDAVELYNRQSLEASIKNLYQAYMFYSSPRIEEFARILLLAVQESDFNNQQKLRYTRLLQNIRHQVSPVVAGLTK